MPEIVTAKLFIGSVGFDKVKILFSEEPVFSSFYSGK
jgi:hypothetical protein